MIKKIAHTTGKEYKTTHQMGDYLRYEIMQRDNFQCQKCKYKGKWRDAKLGIHHIDASGQTENPNDDLDNLITICWVCHPKEHNKLRRKIRRKII